MDKQVDRQIRQANQWLASEDTHILSLIPYLTSHSLIVKASTPTDSEETIKAHKPNTVYILRQK
jgi:hypothetical protein